MKAHSERIANAARAAFAIAFFASVSAAAVGCSLWSSEKPPDTGPPPLKSIAEPADRSPGNQAIELARIDGPVTERYGDEIKMIWEADGLFDFDSAMLNKNATGKLDTLGTILNRYPETRIVITGYTDAEGAEDFNLVLSRRRAESIRDYLVEIGVSPSRLDAFGLGPKQPIAPNDTNEGRRYNKRIEISIRPDPPTAAPSN